MAQSYLTSKGTTRLCHTGTQRKEPPKNQSNYSTEPSGTRIAKLETDRYILSIDVVGDVRVLWNPDPDKSWEDAGTELYKSPCQFPDELMRLFAEGRADGLKNLEIGNNNWFEATLSEKSTGTIVFEDVWDIEDETPGDILNSMCDVIAEYEKEFVS